MDLNEILSYLRNEHDRLSQAIAALEGAEIHGRQGATKPGNGRRRGRRLSAAAKKRISEAAKARWAKARKAGKNRL